MATTKPTKTHRPSPAIQAYLIAYNLAAMSLWAYALLRLVQHLRGDGKVDGAEYGLKAWLGLQSRWEKVEKRSRAGFADGQVDPDVRFVGSRSCRLGTRVRLQKKRSRAGRGVSPHAHALDWLSFQSFRFGDHDHAGLFEGLHGLVAASPFYCSMVFAWSVTEVIRYAHYAAGLLGVKVYVLEWLRYSLFYVLYPLGAGSEATLILKSAGPVRHHFGYVGFFTTVTILSVWPPSLLMMMQHMRRQRYKHLFSHDHVRAGAKASQASHKSPDVNKVVGEGVQKVEQVTSSARDDAAKMVTRSRSRQNLKA
ncbi:BZ3500_MvSof-1268-A1-R1_Chr12-2g03731 [Microbotryum saponariae]|uniref:Very-long-chain (3R)-3-hydroxyacyl-CoA dehydratase n=1 Tax=Microbotryum saponariae TaxID=289078 RepID=A0A2X0KMQ7_9BASI|nr:BZ3500_MvSof-1268-A1-R1_Chr12-2g03731 [Microbotryum saponariae]SDA05319.1 BZ3501_MvSof-1269-A2-R1_Chr12-1g03303 [Microbotryum saponariae]